MKSRTRIADMPARREHLREGVSPQLRMTRVLAFKRDSRCIVPWLTRTVAAAQQLSCASNRQEVFAGRWPDEADEWAVPGTLRTKGVVSVQGRRPEVAGARTRLLFMQRWQLHPGTASLPELGQFSRPTFTVPAFLPLCRRQGSPCMVSARFSAALAGSSTLFKAVDELGRLGM